MNRDIVFNISNNLDFILYTDKDHLPSKHWPNTLSFFKYANEVKDEVNPNEIYRLYISKDTIEENNLSAKHFYLNYFFFINEKRVNVNIKVTTPTEINSKFDMSYYLEVKGQPADEKLVIDGSVIKAYFCIDSEETNKCDDQFNLYFTLQMGI